MKDGDAMHESVLLEEAIASLNLKEDSVIVDMTLGFAGHSSAILKRIKRGFLFAFDQDMEALEYSQKRLLQTGTNFEIIDSNFRYMKKELTKRKIEIWKKKILYFYRYYLSFFF